ncbi:MULTISPECIES: M23 family metallopeptidase [Streptomyces]|uniref:M23 family metallopeptidase n=1 Tax=Streptomyces TaxID=1883 RepID=UPI00140B3F98|nr:MULTISPECIES: M23 family metallopeptidase [Streptomyces]MDH6226105.1 murein DD-endopeptidase MepM/ murein hydrolase activator NlpD [Streptomyces sp. MJP52]
MPSPRRAVPLVPVLLCTLVALAVRPAAAEGEQALAAPPDDGGLSTRVARLYQEAARATEQYQAGTRRLEEERMRAGDLDRLLTERRREAEVIRADLGRYARAQYRAGGGLPVSAQLLLSDDLEALMNSHRAVWRADLAVSNVIEESRRVERRLSEERRRAGERRQRLEQRSAALAGMRQEIQSTLEEARGLLQSRADASVAAGACRGAVRLEQPGQPVAGPWVAPVEGYTMSAGFGQGGARWASRHTGQDFAVPIGTPVRAVGEGRVARVSCGGPFGIEVVIEHPGGYYTQYAHLAAVGVDQGQRVAAGQWIAQSGTSGNSTGPHLHFEVRVTPGTGSALDPVPWLAARGVPLG